MTEMVKVVDTPDMNSLPPVDVLPPEESKGPQTEVPTYNSEDNKMVPLKPVGTVSTTTTPPPQNLLEIPSDLTELLSTMPDPKDKDDGKAPKGIWITQTSKVVVTIYAYKNVETGEMSHVTLEPINEERKKLLGVVEYPITAEFRIPDHRQLDSYREKYAKWSDEAQALLPNRYHLRQAIIKNHLDRIDLIDPVSNEPMALKHDKLKRLTPESQSLLEGLHPTILDLLMIKYERIANLVY